MLLSFKSSREPIRHFCVALITEVTVLRYSSYFALHWKWSRVSPGGLPASTCMLLLDTCTVCESYNTLAVHASRVMIFWLCGASFRPA